MPASDPHASPPLASAAYPRPRNRQMLPELLAPAGSFDKLVAAIHYGADAVYLGGKSLSLRARATNFADDALLRAIAYAHEHNVRVYVTVNVFAHNRDLEGLENTLHTLQEAGADGLIISDPGILALARTTVPGLALHLSTQANVTNWASARFWSAQGACRLNLARELSLAEIAAIRARTDVELEVFVHGALCISYSGRCMLSQYFIGRNANQGDCAHPCRYGYAVMEEKRPGQYFPVEEDERGTYIFNARDLCLLAQLPRLVAAGVDAVKIEGRMKSVGYVGAVVRLYRLALDWIDGERRAGQAIEDLTLPAAFQTELAKIGTRGQSENFFTTQPSAADMLYDRMRCEQQYVPVGLVRGRDPLLIETRYGLTLGEEVEYLGSSIEPQRVVIRAMRLEDGSPLAKANPGSRIVVQTEPMLEDVAVHAVLRKKIAAT